MKEKVVVEGFEDNLGTRNRKGVLWQVLFQASTIVGIIALVALMLNIINGAFGYVAYEAKVDPDTLAVNGIAVQDQSKEQLMALLQSTLSSGAFNKLNSDKPFESRTRQEVYQLVIDRIIRPQIVGVWNLWPSLSQA